MRSSFIFAWFVLTDERIKINGTSPKLDGPFYRRIISFSFDGCRLSVGWQVLEYLESNCLALRFTFFFNLDFIKILTRFEQGAFYC